MYSGKKIRFRAYKEEDMKLLQAYNNDPEIKMLLNNALPYISTENDQSKWFERLSAMNDKYRFAIETLEDSKYIGGCGVNSVDWKNRVVTIGIFIGNKDFWGKGYGSDAMMLLTNFIFKQMNINKIKLYVYAFNERAINTYKKCGFKVEGVLRKEVFKKGSYHDSIIMGLIKEDYVKENYSK